MTEPTINCVEFATYPFLFRSAMTEVTAAGAEAVPIPDHFICPISLEIMQEPVICTDGNTYEKREIERWLETHDTSPKTNMILYNKTLISNFAIKSGIQKFLAANAPKKKVSRTIRTRSSGAVEVTPEPVVERKMQLYVRLLNNSTLSVNVDKNATVQQLSEEIERVDGIRASHQRLIYCGKQMEGFRTLKQYGVSAGGVVHLVLRLVGGGPMVV